MAKDVVVIGGGLGGLSAAIYSRLLGHDVLLLEAGAQVGGKAASIRIGDYRLDPGPSIVILPRIHKRVFEDAGRKMADYICFKRLDPISRIYFEGMAPIDLPANREACEALVSAVAPADATQFRELLSSWDEIAPQIERSIFLHPFDRAYQLLDRNLLGMARKFNMRETYKQGIDARFKTSLLRAFFYGFPSFSGQSYDSKAHGATMIPYLMLQDGVYFPEQGGVGAIPAAYERLAIELGVEIRRNACVQRLISHGSRVTAAVLADASTIRGDAFVSNVDRTTTRRWLGVDENLEPSYSYFTLHWGIRARIDGLRHHTLLVPANFESGFESMYRAQRFPIPPIVYLNETSTTDPEAAPQGAMNLFAAATCPADLPNLEWSTNLDQYRGAMIATMDKFGLSVETETVDFERIQTPQYFEAQHGNYKGSLYGPHEKHRLFGMFPSRNYDEKYRNLFYCGASVQPGAGLPMVVLSGKFAAGKI